jgi:hypothetical protein
LNCSEITALTETVQNGMTAVLPESKLHSITISSQEKNIIGIISVFFGADTGSKSAAANTPKTTSSASQQREGSLVSAVGGAAMCGVTQH